MVVNIDLLRPGYGRVESALRPPRRSLRAPRAQRADECLKIGILNNMAGAAFKSTERQFLSLLDSASDDIPIHVSFYMLPGLSRNESGGQRFASHYSGIDSMLDDTLDGLIVTGREPRMADLRQEPYWDSFTEVLNWARNNTISTVWSCLAAHAAVLHMDGIQRCRGDEKKFGLFTCRRASDHPLTKDLPIEFQVPHSRWNGVDGQDLESHGYTILSRSGNNDVDIFVKDGNSLFVFFQGHLEYDTDTLTREYRRDVGRFTRGEVDTYPLLPRSYFTPEAETALRNLQTDVIASRGFDPLHRITAVLEEARPTNAWCAEATRIYKNWLQCIYARKTEMLARVHVNAACS
jgi:homoserine O-succinyltransferase